jgi:hypothetical protein
MCFKHSVNIQLVVEEALLSGAALHCRQCDGNRALQTGQHGDPTAIVSSFQPLNHLQLANTASMV